MNVGPGTRAHIVRAGTRLRPTPPPRQTGPIMSRNQVAPSMQRLSGKFLQDPDLAMQELAWTSRAPRQQAAGPAAYGTSKVVTRVAMSA